MPGLVPGIHAFASEVRKTWMAGTSPAMTKSVTRYSITISPVMPSSAWVLPSLS